MPVNASSASSYSFIFTLCNCSCLLWSIFQKLDFEMNKTSSIPNMHIQLCWTHFSTTTLFYYFIFFIYFFAEACVVALCRTETHSRLGRYIESMFHLFVFSVIAAITNHWLNNHLKVKQDLGSRFYDSEHKFQISLRDLRRFSGRTHGFGLPKNGVCLWYMSFSHTC